MKIVYIMTTIYFDLEYDHKGRIIEIGALNIFGNKIISQFHCFIRCDVENIYLYNRCAQNSHCIHSTVLHNYGLSLKDAMDEIKLFFKDIKGPILLKGHGTDIDKDNLETLFPFLKDLYVIYHQVALPHWNIRQYEKYHIAALNMKNTSKLTPCHSKYHGMNFFPYWMMKKKQPTQSMIAKLTYGGHCALIDCYELAFFENKLDIFCCDDHFSANFNFDIQPYNEPVCNNIHNPLTIL